MGANAEAHPLLLLLIPVLCFLLLLESPEVTRDKVRLATRPDEGFALHGAALGPCPAELHREEQRKDAAPHFWAG